MIGKENYSELFGFEAKSAVEIKTLVELSKEFSTENNFILLLDNKDIVKTRAVPAYLNGLLHLNEKVMKTESLEKEILIFISNFKDIRMALEEVGAKTNEDFIVLSNSKKIFQNFINEGKINKLNELKLELDYKIASEVFSKNLI
jgi:tRNA threonylcarbamoyladenosine modification (KEOPS) complex Cgi121 subunit